jgi:hypothetical protein
VALKKILEGANYRVVEEVQREETIAFVVLLLVAAKKKYLNQYTCNSARPVPGIYLTSGTR